MSGVNSVLVARAMEFEQQPTVNEAASLIVTWARGNEGRVAYLSNSFGLQASDDGFNTKEIKKELKGQSPRNLVQMVQVACGIR